MFWGVWADFRKGKTDFILTSIKKLWKKTTLRVEADYIKYGEEDIKTSFTEMMKWQKPTSLSFKSNNKQKW